LTHRYYVSPANTAERFTIALVSSGMDTFFLEPLDERMMALVCETEVNLVLDEYCCH
jgi:hypothetical protein